MTRIFIVIALMFAIVPEAKAALMEHACIVTKTKPVGCDTDPLCVTLRNNSDSAVSPLFTFGDDVVIPPAIRQRCSSLGHVPTTNGLEMVGVRDPVTKAFYPAVFNRTGNGSPTYAYTTLPATTVTVGGQAWTVGGYNLLDFREALLGRLKVLVYLGVTQRGKTCSVQENLTVSGGNKTITYNNAFCPR